MCLFSPHFRRPKRDWVALLLIIWVQCPLSFVQHRNRSLNLQSDKSWWFGICFMFPYVGNHHQILIDVYISYDFSILGIIIPIDELIFFRGVFPQAPSRKVALASLAIQGPRPEEGPVWKLRRKNPRFLPFFPVQTVVFCELRTDKNPFQTYPNSSRMF